MKTHRTTIVAMCLFIVSLALPAAGQEWTRFRGPNGQGVSTASTIPVKFAEADYNWKVDLPGDGHGSPVLWGQRIFLLAGSERTTQTNAQRFLVCIRAGDGQVIWSNSYDSTPYPKGKLHSFNNYGSSTPAVDADRVYVYWGSPDQTLLLALNHDGKELWRYDLGTFTASHGAGTSPVLYKDMVIITNDQVGQSFLLALDRKTGKERWRIARQSVPNGTAYAVPCVYESPDQKPQLIFASRANGMTGVDPEAGKVLWEMGDLFNLRVVSSPILAGGLVFDSCGQGTGGTRFVAIKPGASDGSAPPRLAWETPQRIPYVPTGVAKGNLLFTISDGGVATCFDAATGDVKWQERLGQPFFGSPVRVNDVIYCIAKNGQVFVFKAGDQFDLLHTHALGELSYATPAVAGGRMYLRTLSHLVSIGGKATN